MGARLRGTVGMGTGNVVAHLTATGSAVPTTGGEYLESPNGATPANEFIAYVTSTGGASFCVDASVVAA